MFNLRFILIFCVVPLLGLPILIQSVADRQLQSIGLVEETSVSVYVVGAVDAPDLMAFLQNQQGYISSQRMDDADVTIRIHPQFASRIDSQTAAVQVESLQEDAEAQALDWLRAYEAQLLDRRLHNRGVNPDLIDPLDIQTVKKESQLSKAKKKIVFWLILVGVVWMLAAVVFVSQRDSYAADRFKTWKRALLSWLAVASLYGGIVAGTRLSLGFLPKALLSTLSQFLPAESTLVVVLLFSLLCILCAKVFAIVTNNGRCIAFLVFMGLAVSGVMTSIPNWIPVAGYTQLLHNTLLFGFDISDAPLAIASQAGLVILLSWMVWKGT